MVHAAASKIMGIGVLATVVLFAPLSWATQPPPPPDPVLEVIISGDEGQINIFTNLPSQPNQWAVTEANSPFRQSLPSGTIVQAFVACKGLYLFDHWDVTPTGWDDEDGLFYGVPITDSTIDAHFIQGSQIANLQWLEYRDWEDPSPETDVWVNCNATMYVFKNTSVTLRAKKASPTIPWPCSKPQWSKDGSGILGIAEGPPSTIGEEVSVGFTELSTSLSDFKTIVAEAGNTTTVKFIVYELIGILTPDDNFQDRSQEMLGLEEEVHLTHITNPTGVPVTTQWEILDGGGMISGQTLYIAFDVGIVRLWLQVTTPGPNYCGGPIYDRLVIPPLDSYTIRKPESGVRHTKDTCSAGLLAWLYLLPTTVSFYRVDIRESTCLGVGTGFYGHLHNYQHELGDWQGVTVGNYTTGCKIDDDDEVYSGEEPPPFSAGTFTWTIPLQYRGSDGIPHDFDTVIHSQSADSTGKCTINKHAAGPVSAEATDPTSSW
jgi:hypothetical protein